MMNNYRPVGRNRGERSATVPVAAVGVSPTVVKGRAFHFVCILCSAAFLLLGGCVSKREAQLQARQAYAAGQAQAAAQWQAQRLPEVIVRGPVQNQIVPWTEDMTLSKAIVDAVYTGYMNPLLIRVTRNGQIVTQMKGIDLLHGQDVPLQAGDIVDVVP
jgi:hypothetical protein